MALCLWPGVLRDGSPRLLSQVSNPGQALQTLGSAFLNIMWPYELANGKWLLYPVNLTFNGLADTGCTFSGSDLNPLNLSPEGIASATENVGFQTVNPRRETEGRRLNTSFNRLCLGSPGDPAAPTPKTWVT